LSTFLQQTGIPFLTHPPMGKARTQGATSQVCNPFLFSHIREDEALEKGSSRANIGMRIANHKDESIVTRSAVACCTRVLRQEICRISGSNLRERPGFIADGEKRA
jgi:hypothetical protein